MPTLGEELKRRREERNISLADISESTRIGTRFLKAIETDNFSVLPGGIFTRSFIRAYAKEVGMNEDEAVSLYQQQIGSANGEAPAAEKAPRSERATADRRAPRFEPIAMRSAPQRTNWPSVVIAVVIIGFIGIIVYALVKRLNRESAASPPVATQPAPPRSEPAAEPPAAPPSGPAASPPAAADLNGPITVRLEAATGDCWLRYQVDDTPPVTTTLEQGETHDLPPAQNQVRLNLGNRQTLRMTINNREAQFPPDTPKFGAQLTLTRENLQNFLP